MVDKGRKKEDIILDIGYEQTKVGISCDKVPRRVIRTTQLFRTNDFGPAWQAKLEQFLYKVFYAEINYSPNEKTVVLIENLGTRRQIIESFARVLFRKFNISKLELCLSCVSPLYATGRYTGVVVSSGYNFTEIMAIYESYPMTLESQVVNVGSEAISKKLRQLIKINNPDSKDEHLLKEQHLLDLKINHASVAAGSDTEVVQFDKFKIKFSPSWILLDDYFGDPENEDPNIAYSFLKTLNSIADVDCVERVCQNVVLAGGIWHVRGFKSLFKRKVRQQFDNPVFSRLKTLKIHEKIRFAELSFNAVDLPWVGCSIATSIANIEHLTLTKSEYEKKGFIEKIMQSYFLGE